MSDPSPEPDREPRPRPLAPAYSRVSLAHLAGHEDSNLLGNVHGGVIMKLVDSTAGAVAQRHSAGPAVTAAMDEMAFLHPVQIGDIIRTHAQVNWAGTSSMEIGVRVEAQPWDEAGDTAKHVASAYLVFVAVDRDGKPRQIAPLELTSDLERRRSREAEIRRSHRLASKDEIQRGRRGGDGG